MNRLQPTSRTKIGTVVGLLPDKKIKRPAAGSRATPFNPQTFLAKVGQGKTTLQAPKEQLIFSQGDAADAVFYIQAGRVKLTVFSQQGKEAVVGVLEHGSFFGEGCLVGQRACMATATALDASSIVRIEKAAMIRVLHDESAFSELFTAYLLSRNARIQADLVDHLFNSVREAAGANPSAAGPIWERRQAGAGHPEDQPRHTRQHGRHHTLPSEFLSE